MKRAFLYKRRIRITRDVIIPGELLNYSTLSFPICEDIMDRLEKANPDMKIDSDLSKEINIARYRRKALAEIKSKEDTKGDARLYPYQRVGVEWLLAIKRGILADEQGLGKTVESLCACAALPKDARIGIICNKSSISVWEDHIKEFCMGREVQVVNYDRIDDLQGDLDALIVDEAHKMRNRKTRVFSQVKSRAKRSQYLFLLTATPTVNFDQDIWTLLHLCDPSRFSSYWDYIFRFFNVTTSGFGMKIGEVKESERDNLLKIISEYVLSRDESLLDLPDIKKASIRHILSASHREIYRQMEEEWIASLDDKSISADVVVAQITRLRQLAISPALIFPSYEGNDKIDTLISLIEKTQENIVVFTVFKPAVEFIHERLAKKGILSRMFTGSVSGKDREEIIRDFGKGFRVMIITLGTGGESLNLVQATRAMFLDLPWHEAGCRHAMKRIHRIGQDEDVEVTVIKSVDTIEDHIHDIIRRKGKMSVNELISQVKRRRREQHIV